MVHLNHIVFGQILPKSTLFRAFPALDTPTWIKVSSLLTRAFHWISWTLDYLSRACIIIRYPSPLPSLFSVLQLSISIGLEHLHMWWASLLSLLPFSLILLLTVKFVIFKTRFSSNSTSKDNFKWSRIVHNKEFIYVATICEHKFQTVAIGQVMFC